MPLNEAKRRIGRATTHIEIQKRGYGNIVRKSKYYVALIIKGPHIFGGWENTFSPDVRKRVGLFTYSNKNRPTR